MGGKQRLSASVDAELVAVAQEAVAGGQAESVSAWVNDALRLKADQDRRLRALDDFLAVYEAAHGEITEEEMRDAARRARSRPNLKKNPLVRHYSLPPPVARFRRVRTFWCCGISAMEIMRLLTAARSCCWMRFMTTPARRWQRPWG